MTNQSKDVCVIQRSHARDMEGLKRPAGAECTDHPQELEFKFCNYLSQKSHQ